MLQPFLKIGAAAAGKHSNASSSSRWKQTVFQLCLQYYWTVPLRVKARGTKQSSHILQKHLSLGTYHHFFFAKRNMLFNQPHERFSYIFTRFLVNKWSPRLVVRWMVSSCGVIFAIPPVAAGGRCFSPTTSQHVIFILETVPTQTDTHFTHRL